MTHYAKHRVTDFLVPERHHTSKTNCVLIVNDNCCESPRTACRNQRNQNQHRATKIPGEPTMSLLWSVGIHCGYLSGDAATTLVRHGGAKTFSMAQQRGPTVACTTFVG